jgi:hypothetical protein
VDGSVAYQGSYTDIANPVMALRFPTDTGVITTYRFNSTYTTSGCRINFKGSIPDDIYGTGTTLFKLVDYTDVSNNWDENAVSNEISQTVVIQGGP